MRFGNLVRWKENVMQRNPNREVDHIFQTPVVSPTSYSNITQWNSY